MSDRASLITGIVEIECDMFMSVSSHESPSIQYQPDEFRHIRASIYEFWSEETLASYLKDLVAAKAEGRNLFTEKYARMDNLIPPLSNDPLIDKIVAVELKWQEEIQQKYPVIYQQVGRSMDSSAGECDFTTYIRCELETLSHNTLELYYENLKKVQARGENLAEKSLEQLVHKSGYSSLEQAEKVLSRS